MKKKACPHYWIIESPSGSTSVGECRNCGKKRDFPNYFYDLKTTWGTQVRLSWQAPAPISFSDFNPRVINHKLPNEIGIRSIS